MLRLLLSCTLLVLVHGHGRLWWPPSRAAMWRHGFDNPPCYNDNEQFCGGFGYQQANDGKCGVCGDKWDGPLEHVPGPDNIWANGIIVEDYLPGEEITIEVWLTANHDGWFEFRLCPNNDVTTAVTQECLDQNLLLLSPSSGQTGSRYKLPDKDYRIFEVPVMLPLGLECSQCVLQWKYNAANSWGTDEDGTGCVGCGPQEQFYGCADVCIGDPDVCKMATQGPTQTQPTDIPDATPSEWTWPTDGPTDGPQPTTTNPPGGGNCIGRDEYSPQYDEWCSINCAHDPPNCPPAGCICDDED